MKKKLRSNGKLLLTSEYFVLDGALALALPTKLGQELKVENIEDNQSKINWKSYNSENTIWFKCEFLYTNYQLTSTTNREIAEKLISIFRYINEENPLFFSSNRSYIYETFLEFPNEFGLGSSSTLINNLAKFSNTNPYQILQKTFGGSGYDLACAEENQPILFSIKNNKPKVERIKLSENITNELAFIYLNKKQNSREGIALYKSKPENEKLIEEISNLTKQISFCVEIEEFKYLIQEHENVISSYLNLPKVKDIYFNEYQGFVKSLGAWGGDFIAVSKTENYKEYFHKKGFSILYDYYDLIL